MECSEIDLLEHRKKLSRGHEHVVAEPSVQVN